MWLHFLCCEMSSFIRSSAVRSVVLWVCRRCWQRQMGRASPYPECGAVPVEWCPGWISASTTIIKLPSFGWLVSLGAVPRWGLMGVSAGRLTAALSISALVRGRSYYWINSVVAEQRNWPASTYRVILPALLLTGSLQWLSSVGIDRRHKYLQSLPILGCASPPTSLAHFHVPYHPATHVPYHPATHEWQPRNQSRSILLAISYSRQSGQEL